MLRNAQSLNILCLENVLIELKLVYKLNFVVVGFYYCRFVCRYHNEKWMPSIVHKWEIDSCVVMLKSRGTYYTMRITTNFGGIFFHNHRVKELEIIKKEILTHIFDSLALCLIRLMRKSLVTTVIIGIFPGFLNKLFSTYINNNEYSFLSTTGDNFSKKLCEIIWNILNRSKQIFFSVWPNER